MKKDKIIKFLFVIIMLAVIVIAAVYISKLSKTSLDNHEFYQYFAGRKIEYSGEIEINRENQGISNLKMNDVTIQLDSTPIYYKDIENRMILPEDMAVVSPSEQGKMQRITYFSELQIKDNIAYLEYQGKKQSLEQDFLFDGNNLYIFLQDSEITIGEQTYNMSPLSYAIVTYRESVEIYQKSEDTYHVFEDVNIGNVMAKTEDYSINMSNDSLIIGEKEQLLLSSIQNLPNIEWDNF